MEILAYIFAAAIGISLGLIGAGNSIQTVPVLVYLAHIEPVLATAYSLFVVGSTVLVGGIHNAFKRLVDFRTAVIFGIPSILAVYATRAYIMPWIPAEIAFGKWFSISKGTGLLVVLALLMVARNPAEEKPEDTEESREWISKVIDAPRQILEAAGLRVSHNIRWGDAASMILDEAKDWKADTIFPGARSRTFQKVSARKRFIGGCRESELLGRDCAPQSFKLRKIMPDQGLSSREALTRLEKFGRNTLPEKKRNPLWLRFLRQFQSPLIYILLFALVVDIAIWIIEGASGFSVESVAIGLILLINSGLGVYQEGKAAALAWLKQLAAPLVWVLRDGGGVDALAENEKFSRKSVLPFDSKHKYMRVTVAGGGKRMSYLKGAPEVIINRSVLSEEERKNWEEKAEGYAGEGFRILALGWREGEGDTEIHFGGLILLWDPPRAEVPEAIRLAQKAGIF